MLAAENWCLKVKDKIYGPYTTQQMRKFAHEGRLAAWSLIAPAGSRAWREARREMVFATFFGEEAPNDQQGAAKAFGRRTDESDGVVSLAPADPVTLATRRRRQAPESHQANFVVIFDVVSGAASRVEAPIMSLGPAFRIAENVWTVACELTAVGVINAIAPYLRGSESIFVVDATRGRASWRNYAPETASKISASYLKPRVA